MDVPHIIVYINVLSTFIMTGIIWYVQIVHYALLPRIGSLEYVGYQRSMLARTAIVVIPPMLVELGSAVALLFVRPPAVPEWMVWLGVGLVALAWAGTLFLLGPQHALLAVGYNRRLIHKVIRHNWIRTMVWTLRAILTLLMLRQIVA